MDTSIIVIMLTFWMGLQADYDLEEARERLGDRLDREVHSRAV